MKAAPSTNQSIKIRAKDYGLFIDLPNGWTLAYSRETAEFVYVYQPMAVKVKAVEITLKDFKLEYVEKTTE